MMDKYTRILQEGELEPNLDALNDELFEARPRGTHQTIRGRTFALPRNPIKSFLQRHIVNDVVDGMKIRRISTYLYANEEQVAILTKYGFMPD